MELKGKHDEGMVQKVKNIFDSRIHIFDLLNDYLSFANSLF